uniref:UBN2 domain-containing protein n=1 Tax=Tanacetum cinerariifolium TaxID=118510 RepID=A0A6L2K2L7_TANCI|nr:UBN2 domain-containing protein [Tanacetum cinerariifolium]
MRRKEGAIRNDLDAVIQIISLAIVQNLLATKIKRPLSKDLGAIAKMKSRTKPTMKVVSWLNHQMRKTIKLVPLKTPKDPVSGVEVRTTGQKLVARLHIYKNRFETYLKAKDLDLWHIILNGDFPPVAKNGVTQILGVVPFEEQFDDLRKKLAKNEAKMVLYNALPKKNFARFNTIITSLKALDEGFFSNNYVRKFLRALHPKLKENVTTTEELKDLSSLALDGLIGNLKVHEVVMGKYFKIYRGKKERIKSIALKAKKESGDDETSTSKSDDEEYAMTVRNFKKFFRTKDAVIQIISLAIVQNHLATNIKRPSSEVLGAIAKMTPKTKLTMKVSHGSIVK